MCRTRLLLPFAILLFASSVPAAEPSADTLTFEQHIWPIFRAHCFDCHGAEEEKKGNLDLRLVRFMQKGGDSGSVVTPGEPESSYLLDRIRNGEMPPGDAKVTAKEQAVIERWIAQGARTARPEPESIPPGLGILPEERSFWSYQPIQRPEVPALSAAEGVRTPIDAFILRQLRQAELSFAPEADRQTLIQRASFDLTGLPPKPAEVEAFVNDPAPDAYEKLIDRLLASEHYGERWARHWLDVAGYADSEGYTNDDQVRPYAYKYRDYVVRSLNADKPFDQFLVEQLAGDELVPPPHTNLTPEQIDQLIATGFLRMAADGTGSGGVDQAVARNQVLTDTIKIVSTSLLGLSVGCAQCHDHRYDPIPQTDYYRLRAVLEPAYNIEKWRNPAQRRISLYTDADRARAAEIEAEAQKIAAEKAVKQSEYMAQALAMELQKHPEELREPLKAAYGTPAKDRTPEQQKLLKEYPSVNITPGVLYQYLPEAAEDLKKYDARIAEVRAKKPVEDFIRALTEVPGQVPVTRLFHRGDYRQPKDEVPPGGLTVTAPPGERCEIAADDDASPTTGRRLAYARWLTSGRHPLVARVLVNRVWMHHFGRGIVATPSDFGRMGARPTHPELLDWLASEFMEKGWKLKQLHRLMMLSTVYRQSSRRNPDQDAVDSENRLYGRMPVRRLDAEAVRDRILATSGLLQPKLFGPPVPIKADAAGQIIIDGDDGRRSLYVQARRSQPVGVLTAFDAPVMEVNCERRPSSTVATQALLLMNSEFILKHSRQFAERVRREAAAEPTLELPAEFADAVIAPVWQFGYGAFDETTGRTANFNPLPHWTGSNWQGGPDRPDPSLGWVILHASGGHAGNDQQHAAIRRWTAPRDGVITIAGTLKHASESGDGVRGRLVSSRAGLVAEWTAQHGEVATRVDRLEVHRGDTLDLMTDCRESVTSDSFEWVVELMAQDAVGKGVAKWNSQAGFHGPPGPPLPQQILRVWRLAYGRSPSAEEVRGALQFLTEQIEFLQTHPAGDVEPELQAMTNLCQALLSSNEFLYVD